MYKMGLVRPLTWKNVKVKATSLLWYTDLGEAGKAGQRVDN